MKAKMKKSNEFESDSDESAKSNESDYSDKSDKSNKNKSKKDKKNIKNHTKSDMKNMFSEFIDFTNEFKMDDTVDGRIIYEKLPWVERFRPKNLNEIISHETIINTLKKLIKKNAIPQLLFAGPPGTGKTSTIIACMKELYGKNYPIMVLEINASEERGIDVVRTKIKNFVSTKAFFTEGKNYSAHKMVILDEADAMTSDAQYMLIGMIEKYSMNIRFCLICNYSKKICQSIQSRCTIFNFSPLDKKSIEKKLKQISDEMKLKLTNDGIETLIKISNGDMRIVLNTLQVTHMVHDVVNSENIIKCMGFPDKKIINDIYESLMTEPFSTCYKKINNIISINDFSINDIISELFEILLDNFMTYKITQIKFIKIISNLREIEMNSIVCPNEKIQLSGLIGSFKLQFI